jgi:hypothetical protein
LSTFEKGDKALSAISKVTSKVSGALDTLGSKVAGKLDDAVKAVGGKIDDGLDALKTKLGRQAGDDLGGAAAKTVDDAAGGAGRGLKQVGDSGISCPGMSFSPDTTVATRAGPVPISNLHVGDQVLAYDPKTGETKAHTVDAVMVNLDPVVEHLDTSAGPIETTPNHPFFTADRSWVEAGSLLPGEHLRTDSGTDAVVVGFTLEATPSAMWDLTVNTAHSFFVGSGAVLVHNCGDAWIDRVSDGNSHAWTKHVQNEGQFPEVKSPSDFHDIVSQTVRDPNGIIHNGANGRVAYWSDITKTVVIHDPRHLDLGTAFRPFDDINFILKRFF